VENCVNRSISRGESSVLQKDIGFVTEVNNAYDFIANTYKYRIITVNINGNDANAVFNLCLQELAERGVCFNRDN
jgi:thymidylate kinase